MFRVLKDYCKKSQIPVSSHDGCDNNQVFMNSLMAGEVKKIFAQAPESHSKFFFKSPLHVYEFTE